VIIGQAFAWAHIPKAAGDMTASLFGIFPEIIEYADALNGNDKHAKFHERQVEGKLLALNIRRLPSWILSSAQHKATRGLYPDYKPLPMESPRAMSESMVADQRLALFTDGGRLKIDRWLRVEYLTDDFLDFVGRFTNVDPEREATVCSFPRINTGNYDREVGNWFTPEQIDRMYARNPAWAVIEQRVYGD
jgi:hypothetical protein